ELLFRDALDNLPEAEEPSRIAAAKGRAFMRFRQGRHEDAVKDFEEALAAARKGDRKAAVIDILVAEAVVFDWTNDWPRSAAVAAEADARAEGELRTPLVEAQLAGARARTKFRAGDDLGEAASLFERAIALAEPLGDAGYETYTVALQQMS